MTDPKPENGPLIICTRFSFNVHNDKGYTEQIASIYHFFFVFFFVCATGDMRTRFLAVASGEWDCGKTISS
jgi:hypothetical protein